MSLYHLTCIAITLILATHWHSVETVETTPQRTRRSPGLFDKVNPNSLTDKLPVTMADWNSIKDQVTNFGNLTDTFQRAIATEKKARLSLQTLLEAAKDRIEALESSVYPDENNYFSESDACGGILVSQTGRISYQQDLMYQNYEKCVWIVQVNYRSKVKIQLTNFGLGSEVGYDFLSVTEVSEIDGIFTQQISKAGTKYVFRGPLLLITFSSDWQGTHFGFALEFEGVGRNIKTNFNYKHFHITDWSGAFSSSKNLTALESESNNLSLPKMAKPTTHEIVTIVLVPNYRNLTELKVRVNENLSFSPSECNKASLNIYPNFWSESNTKNRCCGTKCDQLESISSDGATMMLLVGEKSSKKDFEFSWEIEQDIPRGYSVDTCGGILNGRAGQISYKVDKEYENNERCVWAIRPTGKSRVKIVLQDAEYEEGYDFVSITTIDPNFEVHNVNNLVRSQSYNFSGPVIFVTFYSDASTFEKGFLLIWEEYGEQDLSSISTFYTAQEEGKYSNPLTGYHAIVINPKYLDGSGLNLKIDSWETQSNFSCGFSGLYIYGNDDVGFSEGKRFCDNEEFHSEEFGASGGIFLVMYRSAGNSDKLGLSWKKGASPKKEILAGQEIVNQTEGCGGILIGDLGKIEYKMNEEYENNARCTWIVQSKTLSKITFKLVKDGFESCCDFLIATPINAHNGTTGESVIINRENRVQSFSTQVVLITFFSDGSIGRKGFGLEFFTSGAAPETSFSFGLNILTTASGAISQDIEDNEKTLVYVLSPENALEGQSEVKETNVSVTIKNFGSDGEEKDSLTFFKIQNPKSSDDFVKAFTCFSDSGDCPPPHEELSEDFTINDKAFIAIFKAFGELDTERETQFSFNWTIHDAANVATST